MVSPSSPFPLLPSLNSHQISIQRLPNKIMRRGGRAAVPRLARCERAAASRPYWILDSLQWPKNQQSNIIFYTLL